MKQSTQFKIKKQKYCPLLQLLQHSHPLLSTALLYFRKQTYKEVGHNWGDSSLEKQFSVRETATGVASRRQ